MPINTQRKDHTLKVLIIRPGALGDTLMLMPAITQLYHKMEILLAGRYPGIDYFKSYVSHCFNYEAHGWHHLFSHRFDQTNMPHIPKVDGLVGYLSDPEKRAASNLKIWFPDTPIHIFPPFPTETEQKHVALYIAQTLQKAGLPINASKTLQDTYERPLLQQIKVPPKDNQIVLHPGSGSQKKNYSPEFWVELIKALKASSLNNNFPMTLLLGPAEEKLLSYFKGHLVEQEIDFSFCPEHEELLSILVRASLYIGHDSGITHLAAMLGTRVVALFKESSIIQWHPLGPAVRVMRGEEGMDFVGEVIERAHSF